MARNFQPWMKRLEQAGLWLDIRHQNRWLQFRRIFSGVGRALAMPLWLSFHLVETWRVRLKLDDDRQLGATYMELIAEASDPALLERAVASFSYVKWYDEGKGSVVQVLKTGNRLMATDTSIRVRETLRARARWLIPSDSQELRLLGGIFTKELVQFFLAVHSYPERFRNSLLEAAFKAGNEDLRPLAALPFDECVARVMASYNHEGRLGERKWLFYLAENHCAKLLKEGKTEDVSRILSHVDRLDLIKSIIQSPSFVNLILARLIAEVDKHETLIQINQFVKTIKKTRLGPRSLSNVFIALADPPPTDIDLSHIIDYISRHPHKFSWKDTCETIISYLNSFAIAQISNRGAVRRFLRLCVDPEPRDIDGKDLWGWTMFADKTRICDNAQTLLDGMWRSPSACFMAQPPVIPFDAQIPLPLTDPTDNDEDENEHVLQSKIKRSIALMLYSINRRHQPTTTEPHAVFNKVPQLEARGGA
ncbi:hypothetical protein SISNIDRAFT_459178 [Sistotremastrum niveocremeum HHB9708]|uniref:Uncharacterized protein n=1 Tax=Sistotremastrum niveocremeum HHB9708 TaxID=1314777 RepID=A0A164PQH8_9AGAM|nr:hypothetical protein SISNIDRAFT_459178 [Sistotremastrum niveocremeum HHB9708]